MTEALLKIGELAARAGVSIRTVDYYTTLGLISPAQRTASNYRLYRPGDVERIHLVQRLEVHGVPPRGHRDGVHRPARRRRARSSDRIDADLRDAADGRRTAAAPEMHGLLAVIATRVHSLITIALQLPPL